MDWVPGAQSDKNQNPGAIRVAENQERNPNNVWKRKSAQRVENEKRMRAKKTLSQFLTGRIPVEFRTEDKKKDFKFLPSIEVLVEFLKGIGLTGKEYDHSGLRTAWGEASILTQRIEDVYERIKDKEQGVKVTKITTAGKEIVRWAFIKDLHYVNTRLKPCNRTFKIHNVLGIVTKEEVKAFLEKLGENVTVENDIAVPDKRHPKYKEIMEFFSEIDEEKRGLTDSFVCSVYSKEPMPSNIPIGDKLITLSGPGN